MERARLKDFIKENSDESRRHGANILAVADLQSSDMNYYA